ncbi:hypothetical protein BKA69DRAFT_1102433 [Paraphysoderma sedebokerense]|nr:hypothetical protein BKA69DRAFT_1102433 [Paraphysoderma sedebokerense]
MSSVLNEFSSFTSEIRTLPPTPTLPVSSFLYDMPTMAVPSFSNEITSVTNNISTWTTPALPITSVISQLSSFTTVIGALPTSSSSSPPLSVILDGVLSTTRDINALPQITSLKTSSIVVAPTFLPSSTLVTFSMPTVPTILPPFAVITSSVPPPSLILTTNAVTTESSMLPATTASSTQMSNPTISTVRSAPIPSSISAPNAHTTIRNVKRTLSSTLNDQGTKLTLKITSSADGQASRRDFSLQTEGAPRAGAKFYSREDDKESSFSFRVELLKLVELNPAVDWDLVSSGNVIDFTSFASKYWSPIIVTDVPNDHHVSIKSISTTFSAGVGPANGNTSMTLEAYMVNDTVTLDSITHSPNVLKYTIKISNFPFKRGDSQLAIVKSIYFKKGGEPVYSSARQSFSIDGGMGRFNWTQSITLDSAESVIFADSSVKVEDVPNTNPQESVAYVVFKIPSSRFTNFVWDPEVILEENKLTEKSNPGSKSGTEKLFSSESSLMGIAVVSIIMALLTIY